MTAKGDFASMFEQSSSSKGRQVPRFEAGQQVEGTVIEISGGLVLVDLGAPGDGKLDVLEFEGKPVQVGDKIRATVKVPRASGPELTLALGRGGTAVNLATLELALAGKTPVSGSVTAAVKGGFSIDLAGTRAFCPISQIDLGYVTTPEAYVGQTFEFQVIEIKEGGRNVIVSRKALLEARRRDAATELLGTLQVGATVSGTVKSTVKSGVLVDLGGLDGYIHISELARSRVDRPEDVVSVGENVTAQVLSIEHGERGVNVRLSLKALSPEPAPGAAATQVDEILTGQVVRHVPGGVIVGTEKGEGLVPTRELELAPGADFKRSYPIGFELRVVVVSRDPTNGKLRFSVGRVAQVEERQNYREFHKSSQGAERTGSLGSLGSLLGDKLGQWAASSSEAKPAAPAKPAASSKPSASSSSDKKPEPAPRGPAGVHRGRR